jgi:hypothetical protein
MLDRETILEANDVYRFSLFGSSRLSPTPTQSGCHPIALRNQVRDLDARRTVTVSAFNNASEGFYSSRFVTLVVDVALVYQRIHLSEVPRTEHFDDPLHLPFVVIGQHSVSPERDFFPLGLTLHPSSSARLARPRRRSDFRKRPAVPPSR